GPTHDELQALQDKCAGDMNMMRHCRQCRADAVGMLGEDRGDEFTMDKVEEMQIDYEAAMEKRAAYQEAALATLEAQRSHTGESFVSLSSIKTLKRETRPVLMAVATTGGGVINQHFGHAREFLIYEASMTDVRFIGHRKVDLYCSGGDTCGDAETTLQKIIRTLDGCEAVLCSKIGYEPWEQLEDAGIQPNGEHAMEPIEDAVVAVYAEMVEKGLPDKGAAKTGIQASA
ncbi:MAG: NifB/NifX family molybdenum-iron cluster-binding protein, partial [Candidatus Thiodiazotropha endolucinida]